MLAYAPGAPCCAQNRPSRDETRPSLRASGIRFWFVRAKVTPGIRCAYALVRLLIAGLNGTCCCVSEAEPKHDS
jgi:hypothetical protein